MGLQKLISNYSAFNEWANNELVVWLKQQDQVLLYAKTPSSYNTIDYTLQHILRAQKFWLAFITEQDVSNFNWAVRESEVENILNEINAVSKQMKLRFALFTNEELETTLHFEMPWAKNNLSRYEYIIHVINHSSYHRGQVITMARCVGIDKGVVNTDYNIFNSKV